MKVMVKDLIGQAVPLAGRSGLKREIKSPHVRVPELASPSTWKNIGSGMVHLTPAQGAYLRSLSAPERVRLIRAFLRKKPAGIAISGSSIHQELLRIAESVHIPVFKTKSAVRLTHALAQKFTLNMNLHGVLVEVFGLGTLILGESAIGKSEAALDLVLRGHKLAADDLVVLEKKDGQIRGRATDMGTNLLEVRGLGVIDVRALYGKSATVGSAPVGLVVELEEWKQRDDEL